MTWQQQGTVGVFKSQDEQGLNTSPWSGAIQTVIPDPNNANVIYIGTINGGIWKTENGSDTHPKWTPLTDSLSSLSIGAMAMSPTNSNTLIAGVGNFSSFREGGPLTGVFLTQDSGKNWQELGQDILKEKNISAIAIRTHSDANNQDTHTILVGAKNGGLFRSTDSGKTFTPVSGPSGTNFSQAKFSDIVGDPGDSKRFYAAILGVGLVYSSDEGATWEKIDIPKSGITEDNNNIKLSVSYQKDGTTNEEKRAVYVGIINKGNIASFFRGEPNTTGGIDSTSWKAMDLPEDQDGGILNGQGENHFAVIADPQNVNIVYVAGQSHPKSPGGRALRGDGSAETGKQWTSITHEKADPDGSGPLPSTTLEADTRNLAFDKNGDLLAVTDSAVYRRTQPQEATGVWTSLSQDLPVMEFHSVAWDAQRKSIIGGIQDVGVTELTASSGKAWQGVATLADGGVVAVDDSDPQVSYTYSSYQELGSPQRRKIETTEDGPKITVETPLFQVFEDKKNTNLNLFKYEESKEGSLKFYPPLELNKVETKRLVLASHRVYESPDQGDTLNIIGDFSSKIDAMAYGGKSPDPQDASQTINQPNVLYVTTGQEIYLRQPDGTKLEKTGYNGAEELRDIVLNPLNWKEAYAVSSQTVYRTKNAGVSWEKITGNLTDNLNQFWTVEFIPTKDHQGCLVVGGTGGVYQLIDPANGSSSSSWSKLDSGLPEKVMAYDLRYNPTDDTLVLGTLGRSVWTLGEASQAVTGVSTTTPTATDPPSGPVKVLIGDAKVPENIAEYKAAPASSQSTTDDFNDLRPEEEVDELNTPPQLNFTVTLSKVSDTPINVNYKTEDGTAQSGSDYTGKQGILTFLPGETQKNIEIPIIDDSSDEPDQNFQVSLSNATGGATIADNQGEALIQDNDLPPPPQQTIDPFAPLQVKPITELQTLQGILNNPNGGITTNSQFNSTSTTVIPSTILPYPITTPSLPDSNNSSSTPLSTPTIFIPPVFTTLTPPDIRGEEGDDSLTATEDQPHLDGGDGNDTLVGTDQANYLVGNGGNDSLLGNADRDTLTGNNENDTLYGQEGDDLIDGGLGRDLINGNQGQDTIMGGEDQDQVYGGKGDDLIYGGQGKDELSGDQGSDTLIGVNIMESTPRLGEIDTLKGGAGRDYFVLGIQNVGFYDDQNSNSLGVADYALLTDFNPEEDVIRLSGTIDDYVFESSPMDFPSGVAIFLKTSKENELVAIVQNTDVNTLAKTPAIIF